MTRDEIMAEAELCSMTYAHRHGIDRHHRDVFDVDRDARLHLAGMAWESAYAEGERAGYTAALEDVEGYLGDRLAAIEAWDGVGDDE